MSISDEYPNPLPIPPTAMVPPTRRLDSTITLLDSLSSFYQQEKAWVYRTRAALELATYQNHPGVSKADAPPTPPPSATQTATQTSETGKTIPIVKTEPTSSDADSKSGTRWIRRKKNFKLQLEGISTTNRRSSPRQRREASERLLTLFQNMMETRMESCQRVHQLVRNANRADLDGVLRR